MASGNFEVKRKSDGTISKLHARLSENKEINVTALHGKAYVHINQLKTMKEGAKYARTNAKSASLNMDEIQVLRAYLLNIEQQVQEFLHKVQHEETPSEQPQSIETIQSPALAQPIETLESAALPWEASAEVQQQHAQPHAQPITPSAGPSWGAPAEVQQHVHPVAPSAPLPWGAPAPYPYQAGRYMPIQHGAQPYGPQQHSSYGHHNGYGASQPPPPPPPHEAYTIYDCQWTDAIGQVSGLDWPAETTDGLDLPK